VKCIVLTGGTSVEKDISSLRAGVHVVVATPGRVMDMLRRRALDFKFLKVVILDEADEMLSVGFEVQLQEIFKMIPKETQIGIFSATMPPEIITITKSILINPIRIIVKAEQLTLQGIRQFYVNVEKEEWKLDTLLDMYSELSICQSVIFCNSRNRVKWLYDQMSSNFPVIATHGELDVQGRDTILKQFRDGLYRIIITTDLLARGIDVQQVSLVINFDLPRQKEIYLHRIGRSGRFGRRGLAISLITERDAPYLRDLERYYDTQVDEMPKNIADFL